MKNIIGYSIIGVYSLLYIVGTLVAYSDKNMLTFAFFIGGACAFAGLHFGRWTAKRDQVLLDSIRR